MNDKKRMMPSIIVSLIKKDKGIPPHDEATETPEDEKAEFTEEQLEEGCACMEEFEKAASTEDKVIALVRFIEWFNREHDEESEGNEEIDPNTQLPGNPGK
jgi:hypothetical protein